MINIDELAIDIGLINNSFYTNNDIPEIKRILIQAQENGELDKVRIWLKHSDFEMLATKGYHIHIPAYEDSKAHPAECVHRIAPARPTVHGDYEEAILARQEEMWQD